MVGEILVEHRAAAALGGEAQDGLVAQSFRQRRCLAASAPRAHPDEGLVEQVPVVEAAWRFLARHHGEIDIAIGDETHAGARVRGDDLKADRRFLVEQVAKHWRQQAFAEIVARRHAKRAGGTAAERRKLAERGFGPGPQLAHDGKRGLARRRETDAAAGALEELDAEMRLEAPDLLAHRRRADVTLARRRPDRARARHRDQRFECRKQGGVDHEEELNIRRTTFHWTAQSRWGSIRVSVVRTALRGLGP